MKSTVGTALRMSDSGDAIAAADAKFPMWRL